MNFKIIYANGDSFVSGEELASAELAPELSTVYALGECHRLSQREFVRQHINHYTSPELYNEKIKLEKMLAFPAAVGKHFNKPVVNDARGGQSNQATCSRTIEYLEKKLLKRYRPGDILVIIGLTSLNRIKIPGGQITESKMLGADNTHPVFGAAYIKEISDTYLKIDNLINFLGLIYFLNTNKISYLFTDSCFYTNDKNSNFNTNSLFPTVDLIMKKEILPNEKAVHEGGHFSAAVHERFANSVINYINNTL